jgi:16S rRNA (guanine(966)-N(2))-methyltransferase RsmD
MRVIAGSARGRRLEAPPGLTVRPTGDKVKGAIFSLLEALAYRRGCEPPDDDERFASVLAWPRVLDLYAGTGALGIEALSRGATKALFVEPDPAARRVLLRNLMLARVAERAEVVGTTAERALVELRGNYDLVLADPPYADPNAARVLEAAASSTHLSEQAVLVWEHASANEAPARLGPLTLDRTRRHGRAAVSLYTRQADATSARECL